MGGGARKITREKIKSTLNITHKKFGPDNLTMSTKKIQTPND
jgi:hypothetical protein